MNKLLKDYIVVEGKDKALQLASTLLDNDYQVMVQLDDCDIYIVAYTVNSDEYGNKFACLNDEEIDSILSVHQEDEDQAAIERVREMFREGYINITDIDC